MNHLSEVTLKDLIKKPNTKRLSAIFAGFENGMSDELIYGLSHIHPWFVDRLRFLWTHRVEIGGSIGTFKMVDTCAGEFRALTPYFYSTHGATNEAEALLGDKVIILGSGAIRI